MLKLFFATRNSEIDFHSLQNQVSKGDQQAFARLYGLFNKRLLAFSISLVHSPEIAEEVVEDVFVKLWANRSEAAAIRNLAVYLYVAVKNQSLNRLSSIAKDLHKQPFDSLDPGVEAFRDDPHDLMVTAEMLAKMNQVIDQLPPRCKMIFKLIREDGLRYKEVSEILNISVKTIDAQMAIAIKRICEALGVQRHVLKTPQNQDIQKNLKKS